jgi:hypothetical protein
MTSASPSMTTRPATVQTVLKLTRRRPNPPKSFSAINRNAQSDRLLGQAPIEGAISRSANKAQFDGPRRVQLML